MVPHYFQILWTGTVIPWEDRCLSMRQLADATIAGSHLHVTRQGRYGQHELFTLCAWISGVMCALAACMDIRINPAAFSATSALVLLPTMVDSHRHLRATGPVTAFLQIPVEMFWAFFSLFPLILLGHGLFCAVSILRFRRNDAEWMAGNEFSRSQGSHYRQLKKLLLQVRDVIPVSSLICGVVPLYVVAMLHVHTLKGMQNGARFGTQWVPAVGFGKREIWNSNLKSHLLVSHQVGKKKLRQFGLRDLQAGDFIVVNGIPMIPTHVSDNDLQQQIRDTEFAIVEVWRRALCYMETSRPGTEFQRNWSLFFAIDMKRVEALDRPFEEVMNAFLNSNAQYPAALQWGNLADSDIRVPTSN